MSGKTRQAVSRRQFLGGSIAVAGASIVPSYVLGGNDAPSNKLNAAQIGAGGKGNVDSREVDKAGGKIVAICDVDHARAAGTIKRFKDARTFKDYRKMLDTMGKDIDAVIVTTPDHMHAPIALRAMAAGKHVYCQKPLTRTPWEARLMTEAAAKYGVVTQMGNQGHSGHDLPATMELINAGAVGAVTEVHVWTDRPGGWWKQGIPLPTETPAIPDSLDWDLWLGVSPVRPYHKHYVPFGWRGWVGLGTGALGDMGCHNMDVAYSALKLGAPSSVKATCAPFNQQSFPAWSIIEWRFPADGDRGAVKIVWYDGGKKPERPSELEASRKLASNGSLFIGEKGTLLGAGSYSTSALIPETKRREFGRPKQTLPRSIGHYKEWVVACKGEKTDGKLITPGTHFGYSGPMTESVLLGNIALHYPGQELQWNPKSFTFTNNAEATGHLKPEYRKEWTL